MAKQKSWREKLADSKDLPKVEPLRGRLAERLGPGTMAIPAPVEVDEIMRRVPEGKLITVREIREQIAKKHGATMTCPLTTGIFAWIAAHAAEEGAATGEKGTTPYWRTLKTGGELNEKFPGGADGLRKRLEAEGHQVVARGRRLVVEGYESRLAFRE